MRHRGGEARRWTYAGGAWSAAALPGPRTEVAVTGAEAYDVIIADIRLPDMNGYELLVKLREVRDLVPLVLMTGFGYDPGHSIVKARQAGIDLVLFKPFRVDQLLDTVEKVLGRSQALVAGAAGQPASNG